MSRRRATLILLLATVVATACAGSSANRPPPSPGASGVPPTPLSPPGLLLTPGPPTITLPDARVEAVGFIDARHGWVVQDAPDDNAARRILTTSDGGATWTPLARLPYPIGGLDFADAAHGWAVTDRYTRGTLLATSDGGSTWSTIRERDQPITAFALVSPDVGWTIDGAGLQMTMDDGRTWTDTPVPCDGRDPTRLFVAFASASNGLFACTVAFGAGFEGKALYATHDGGTTWTEIPRALGDGGYLSDIQSLDDRHAWYSISYPAATLFASADGGASWTPLPLPGGRGYFADVRSIDFIDPAHGWVVACRSSFGPGVLLMTADGGATWTPVTVAP